MGNNHPVVVLCGSSKQKSEWEKYRRELDLKGYCTLGINVYLGLEVVNHNIENKTKELLVELHRQRIRMADIIAVIPKPDGSIGVHTTDEIAYANSLGKKVVDVGELLKKGEEGGGAG